MPHYDYQCGACSHLFEAHQKMSDDKLVDCPQCGEPKLDRLLGGGGAGFVLKGEGFYQNDYQPGSSGDDKGHSGGG